MKLTVRPDVRLDGDGSPQGGLTAFMDHGDMRLSARATDETLKDAGSLKGLTLRAEKAGAFRMTYDMGSDAPSFRFHNTCEINDKTVSMRFRHVHSDKGRTDVEMGAAVNDDNRLTVRYNLTNHDKPDLKNCSVKWRYTKDDLSVEPGWDFGTEAAFGELKYRLDDENRLSARMNMHNNVASLAWTNTSGLGGGGDTRIIATMNMDDGLGKMPTIQAHKYWDVDF